jgi:hypothetical protein
MKSLFGPIVNYGLSSNHFTIGGPISEPERQVNFMKNFYFERLACVSEFDERDQLSSKKVKVPQGREYVYTREIFETSKSIVIGTSLLFVNNNVIRADKLALYDHISLLEAPFHFTESKDEIEKNPKFFKEIITDLDYVLTKKNYQVAFLKLLMESYSEIKIPETDSMISFKNEFKESLGGCLTTS